MSSCVILWQSAAWATALPTAFPQHRGTGFWQVPPGRIPSDAVGTTVTSLPSWDPRSLPGAGGLQLSPSGSPHVCSSGRPVADSLCTSPHGFCHLMGPWLAQVRCRKGLKLLYQTYQHSLHSTLWTTGSPSTRCSLPLNFGPCQPMGESQRLDQKEVYICSPLFGPPGWPKDALLWRVWMGS